MQRLVERRATRDSSGWGRPSAGDASSDRERQCRIGSRPLRLPFRFGYGCRHGAWIIVKLELDWASVKLGFHVQHVHGDGTFNTDEIKQKVEAKFNELGDLCERGEMEPEQAYELFKDFEDKMVAECTELMAKEMPTEADELTETGIKKVELHDPPGEGPVLRWESRIVFAPSGDAYHPKNRKVKLSVTVKELGLSRHACRRLREIVGKRYNSGKDELTITSERFEHREENRKDCLRTLYTLIEDAMKADKLVEDARNAYVKGRLKTNPQFMERLKRKMEKLWAAA
ncbi:hypothetical protein SETIT_1G147800v2 [Setaria italica]|uniref:Small ribosomal subunit protein mS35 mitochondrial conserved domain-containing protein n=1 Tax=Setaria italica TaxID=4555 RepID=A0A368PKV6_SETIT|nr:hypothetical protein SETIT_1G147800v2 [Setaria italica]